MRIESVEDIKNLQREYQTTLKDYEHKNILLQKQFHDSKDEVQKIFNTTDINELKSIESQLKNDLEKAIQKLN